MVVQHNIPALNSHRNLGLNNKSTSGNLEKLSSGFRINRAADDAAGLAISEKMRGQIRGLAMAENNTENGVSLIKTAEGGLNETHAILQRMRELAVQSSNGTYQDSDREQIALEVQALKDEIDRIAASTNYNQINLLDGSLGSMAAKGADSSGNATQIAADAALTSMGISADTLNVTIAADYQDTFADKTATFNVRSNGTSATAATLSVGDKTYLIALTDLDFGGEGTTPALDTAGDDIAQNSIYEMTDKGYVKVGDIAAGFDYTAAKISGTVSKIKFDATGAAFKTEIGSEDDESYVATEKSELIFQIGANGGLDQKVGLHVESMGTGNLGLHTQPIGDPSNTPGTVAGLSILTREQANAAIDVIDAAVNQVSAQRANLGALQNRLEHTLNNLGVTKENLTASESTIRDVDMAKEMMEYTKNSILVQASQAMLAQANQLPQGVLSLLK